MKISLKRRFVKLAVETFYNVTLIFVYKLSKGITEMDGQDYIIVLAFCMAADLIIELMMREIWKYQDGKKVSK